MEIKTPSSKKLVQGCIREAINLHGPFSVCRFWFFTIQAIGLQDRIRIKTQHLHHVAVSNLPYFSFIVLGQAKIQYATLIRFHESEATVMGTFLSVSITSASNGHIPLHEVLRILHIVFTIFANPLCLLCAIYHKRGCLLFVDYAETVLVDYLSYRVATTKGQHIFPDIVIQWN